MSWPCNKPWRRSYTTSRTDAAMAILREIGRQGVKSDVDEIAESFGLLKVEELSDVEAVGRTTAELPLYSQPDEKIQAENSANAEDTTEAVVATAEESVSVVVATAQAEENSSCQTPFKNPQRKKAQNLLIESTQTPVLDAENVRQFIAKPKKKSYYSPLITKKSLRPRKN